MTLRPLGPADYDGPAMGNHLVAPPVEADAEAPTDPAVAGDEPAAWYRLPPDQWGDRAPAPPPTPPARRIESRGATVTFAAVAVVAAVGVAAVAPAVLRQVRREPAPTAAPAGTSAPGEATAPPTTAAPTTDPAKGVYLVTVDGCGLIGKGSGFALDAHHVVTNAHVVQQDAHPQLRAPTGERYVGQVIGASGYLGDGRVHPDGEPDVAVIEVEVALAAWLRWASAAPREGEVLVGMTFPEGVFTPTTGTVVERRRQGFDIRGDFDHGSSGGPVTSRDGQVYGIVTGGNDAGGRAFAFDAAVLQPRVEAMLADPHPGAGSCPSS